MNLMEKLSAIQNELKVPKGQMNKFGGYKYRSAEDILEAVKPVCAKYKAVLILSDEIIQLGNRYYINATASLYDYESELKIEVTALAREAEQKKGMDESQISGTASSYARKYAMNGLFNIDDTKDADTNEYHEKQQKAEQGSHKKYIDAMNGLFASLKDHPEKIEAFLKKNTDWDRVLDKSQQTKLYRELEIAVKYLEAK